METVLPWLDGRVSRYIQSFPGAANWMDGRTCIPFPDTNRTGGCGQSHEFLDRYLGSVSRELNTPSSTPDWLGEIRC
jgi:hypothetical protein